MSTIINGTSDAITFPDATIQNTSAVVSGKVPYSVLPAGSVLQVVNAVFGTQVSINSGTMTATGLTASITPKYSTSKVLVLVDLQGVYSSGTISGSNYSIYKNGSLLSKMADVAGYINSASGDVGSVSANYLDSPATTSSTTYAIYFNRSIGSSAMYMNEGGGCSSAITLMEIAG